MVTKSFTKAWSRRLKTIIHPVHYKTIKQNVHIQSINFKAMVKYANRLVFLKTNFMYMPHGFLDKVYNHWANYLVPKLTEINNK